MMKNVTVAGVLGGIVLFVWGAVSHMMLPLGMEGLRSMSTTQESTVVSAMQSAMHERAIYFFPGMDMSKAPSPEEEKAWKARYASGPAGIVVFNPRPGSPMSAGMLMTELASNIVAALLAALLIGFVPGVLGYGKRALLVGLIGLLVAHRRGRVVLELVRLPHELSAGPARGPLPGMAARGSRHRPLLARLTSRGAGCFPAWSRSIVKSFTCVGTSASALWGPDSDEASVDPAASVKAVGGPRPISPLRWTDGHALRWARS